MLVSAHLGSLWFLGWVIRDGLKMLKPGQGNEGPASTPERVAGLAFVTLPCPGPSSKWWITIVDPIVDMHNIIYLYINIHMWYTPLTKWDAAPSLVQWQIDFNVAVLVGKWCMSPDGDCHPTVSFQRSLKPSLRQWQDPHKVRERVVRKCGLQSDSISNRLRSNKLGILPRFQGHPCRRMCGRSGLCRSAAWQEQSALIRIVFRENLRETLTVRLTKSWFPLRGTQLRYIGGSSQAYWHIGSEWIYYAVMFMDYIPVSREKPNHRPLLSRFILQHI